MIITPELQHSITEELLYDFGGKMDGSRRNILIPNCPFCGHGGFKYGIYVGPKSGKKQFGASNCFSCGRSFGSLKESLKALGREDLIPKETAELDDTETDISAMFEDEIDDDLVEVVMPKGYKRCHKNRYLKSRGWNVDDFEYFPVGTNRGFDREYSDYVILEIIDEGRTVGFVARSILSKEEIEDYNSKHHFKIRRYKNSDESIGNGFSKMLYNYDAIEPMVTHSVILCEGPFDVVGLNRKLELYENKFIVPIATFGKKSVRSKCISFRRRGLSKSLSVMITMLRKQQPV